MHARRFSAQRWQGSAPLHLCFETRQEEQALSPLPLGAVPFTACPIGHAKAG